MANTQMTERKERIWSDELKRVDLLTDRLGLRVDKGIRESVAILHLFNINTTASHEGKIDRYPVPYVDVKAPGTAILIDQLKVNDSGIGGKNIINRVLRKNLTERRKVISLLEEFYATRKTPYETRLGITSFPYGWSRIESLGADFQDVEKSKNLRKQRLLKFQKEMRAFTEFLKKKYFLK